MTLIQNNGIVEGKVNKLKLIKRMGYGRAAFPLLRQRVLHALRFQLLAQTSRSWAITRARRGEKINRYAV